MPIDLPSSSQTSVRGNQNPVTNTLNQRQNAVQSVLNALNIRAGETANAVVKAVTNVDEQLRVRLMTLANPETANAETAKSRLTANASPSAPLNSDQTSGVDLMALLKGSPLKLVEIEVKGQSVLTLTNQSVKVGADVQVLRQNNSLLLIPGQPAATTTTTGPEVYTLTSQLISAYSERSYNTPLSASANSDANTALNQRINNNNPPNRFDAGQMGRLHLALRELMPAQVDDSTPVTKPLAVINLLAQQLKQPEQTLLRQQLPPSLQESLHILASHLRTPQQLSQPKTLKQAITNSGLQFENKLATKPSLGRAIAVRTTQDQSALSSPGKEGLLTNAPPSAPRTLLKSTTPKPLPESMLSRPTGPPVGANNASYNPTTSQTASTSAFTLPKAVAEQVPTPSSSILGKLLARQDLKAALLYLLTQLPPAIPSAVAESSLNGNGIELLLKQFLGQTKDKQNTAAQQSKGELLQQMQQQVTTSLSKILFQQLQSLQRSQPQGETAPTQHWQLDIPIRYGHEVQNMNLRMDEEWMNDYQQASAQSSGKVRQWLVKLAFDFPDAGSLHAHLVIIEETVSASLWAENPATLAKTQGMLTMLKKRLEKDGVTVNKIECFAGKPVEEQTRLDYSLVDIRT